MAPATGRLHLGWDQGHRTLDITVKGTTKRIPLPSVVADALDEMLAERELPAGDGAGRQRWGYESVT